MFTYNLISTDRDQDRQVLSSIGADVPALLSSIEAAVPPHRPSIETKGLRVVMRRGSKLYEAINQIVGCCEKI